jgi:hypothetical protein
MNIIPPTQIPSKEPIPSLEGILLLSTIALWSMVEGMKVSQTSSFQQEATPIYNINNMQKIEKNM